MDISTIAGYIVGSFCFVVVGIGIDKVGSFVHIPSIAIVFGGGMGATMIAMTLDKVINTVKIVKFAFIQHDESPVELIKHMVEYAEIARRDGILALENVSDTVSDTFLIKGIQLAVDGTDPELISQILNTELENLENRHAEGRQFFDLFTKYAPAWGMIGTLVGLINMLAGGMDDPNALTKGMATALITTMYGAIIANFAAGPLSDKLAARSAKEMQLKNIILHGVMSIQSGDNPRIVEQKLKIYLAPSERMFGQDQD